MNRRDILSANLRRDLALASPRSQRVSISTMPWYFLQPIFFGLPVTLLFWCTYLVVNLTSNGESIWAARGFLLKQFNCSVAGKGVNDE